MKPKFILIIISGLLLGMIACKKGNSNNALNGKWQQTKLRTYIVDSGKITYDTTYLHPFTNLDYIQFMGGNCSISTDHYYYDNSPGKPKIPQLIGQSVGGFSYTAIGGGKFVLDVNSHITNPGGFAETDTVTEVNANSLILHRIFYTHVTGYSSVTDSYYEK